MKRNSIMGFRKFLKIKIGLLFFALLHTFKSFKNNGLFKKNRIVCWMAAQGCHSAEDNYKMILTKDFLRLSY